MVAKQKQRVQEFKEEIEGDQLEYFLTLDECLLPTDYTNGETKHYYATQKIGEEDRPAPLASSAQQSPEPHMMAAGFCWNGQTQLFFIPERTKVKKDQKDPHTRFQRFLHQSNPKMLPFPILVVFKPLNQSINQLRSGE